MIRTSRFLLATFCLHESRTTLHYATQNPRRIMREKCRKWRKGRKTSWENWNDNGKTTRQWNSEQKVGETKKLPWPTNAGRIDISLFLFPTSILICICCNLPTVLHTHTDKRKGARVLHTYAVDTKAEGENDDVLRVPLDNKKKWTNQPHYV
jgi:hypothetical protein